MKKLLLGVALSFLLATNAFGADVSRAHTFVDAEILTAALLNGEFDPIVTALNDIEGEQLKSNIAITTSGASTFSGGLTSSGTFTTTGNTLLGNGADTLTINNSAGITYTPAATWTFTGAQTVSGTWANLGIVTTADINGGTIDGATIGAASATTGKFTTVESTIATGTAPLTVASTTVVTNLNADTVDGYTSAGMVVQVVNYQTGAYALCSAVIPSDDSIPEKTEGTEVMTLAIIPKSATNKLKIEVVVNFASNVATDTAVALFQDTTTNAIACGSTTSSHGNYAQIVTYTHYMTAGTTLATTFKVRIGGTSGTEVYFNGATGAREYGGVLASSITITEIAG